SSRRRHTKSKPGMLAILDHDVADLIHLHPSLAAIFGPMTPSELERELGLVRIGDHDEDPPIRMQVFPGPPEDILTGHRLDDFGIPLRVVHPETVKLHAREKAHDVLIGVEPQGKAPGEEP